MGTLAGHLSPGMGLLLMGLWHLYNTVALYARAPAEFRTRLWFEPSRSRGVFRYAELVVIITGCSLSLVGELFLSSSSHLPLDRDLSIPVDNLNNFEHAMIFFFFITYASVLLYVDVRGARVPGGLLQLVAAAMLGVEALMFHFHSADHAGAEGRFHWFFVLVVLVGMACTLIEIPCPTSFLVTLVRSLSLVFQGLWLIHIGLVLFVPAFLPKGCTMGDPDSESDVLVCDGPKSVMRAKALANLQFCLYLAVVVVATMAFFLRMTSAAAAASSAQYQSLRRPRNAVFTLRGDGADDDGDHPPKHHRHDLLEEEDDDEESCAAVHALNVQSHV